MTISEMRIDKKIIDDFTVKYNLERVDVSSENLQCRGIGSTIVFSQTKIKIKIEL